MRWTTYLQVLERRPAETGWRCWRTRSRAHNLARTRTTGSLRAVRFPRLGPGLRPQASGDDIGGVLYGSRRPALGAGGGAVIGRARLRQGGDGLQERGRLRLRETDRVGEGNSGPPLSPG